MEGGLMILFMMRMQLLAETTDGSWLDDTVHDANAYPRSNNS